MHAVIIAVGLAVGVSGLLAVGDGEAPFWNLGIKLVRDAADYRNDPRNRRKPRHFHLVLHDDLLDSCLSTHAFPVWVDDWRKTELPEAALQNVSKCGPYVSLLCTFYSVEVLRQNPATASAFQRTEGDYLGYMISNDWVGISGPCPADPGEFLPIEHPFKVLHPSPSFIGSWLQRRLSENGFPVLSSETGKLAHQAVQALPGVCTTDVRDVWGSLWPGASTAKSMIIIGCAGMASEPTQPLLEKGAGGVFIDRDLRGIRLANYYYSASNRLIINATVRAESIGDLVQRHRAYAEHVEVVQVDIDTGDGPVVMALLEVTKPLAVVVEVRDMLPMPFRYACLTSNVKGSAMGGANLAYWMHELGQRSFRLARLDDRDAVFFHDSVAKAQTRDAFLGAMACYMYKYGLAFRPSMLFASSRSLDESMLFRQHWLESHPHDVVDDVWSNLTSHRSDVPFSLLL